MKSSKVRQVLADLALSQVSNKKVEYLNISELRRLAIGVQLVRDPGKMILFLIFSVDTNHKQQVVYEIYRITVSVACKTCM